MAAQIIDNTEECPSAQYLHPNLVLQIQAKNEMAVMFTPDMLNVSARLGKFADHISKHLYLSLPNIISAVHYIYLHWLCP